jgi:hypothetical protein
MTNSIFSEPSLADEEPGDANATPEAEPGLEAAAPPSPTWQELMPSAFWSALRRTSRATAASPGARRTIPTPTPHPRQEETR